MCQACNLAGRQGQCLPIGAGADPAAECTPGVCDGAGSCAVGQHLLSKRFGGGLEQRLGGLALDPKGNMLIGGWFSQSFAIGPQTLSYMGDGDIFVAKLDAAGQHVWSARYGDGWSEQLGDLSSDKDGNVIVAGAFREGIDFGCGAMSSPGDENIFVAKLDSDGGCMFNQSYGGAGNDAARAVATEQSVGHIGLVGTFSGSVTFKQQMLISKGKTDGFVLSLSASGAYRWSRVFGDAGEQSPEAIAIDANNNTIVGGRFEGTINLGGADLKATNGSDVFIAKLGPNGEHLWSKSFGGLLSDVCNTVAVDSNNNVVLAGFFQESIDFGLGPLTTVAGGADIFVVKLNPSGKPLWSKSFGAKGVIDYAAGVAIDRASDAVVLTGRFVDEVDFGGGMLIGAGSGEVFVAKLAANSTHLWSHRYGDVHHETGVSIAVDSAGQLVAGGYFSGSIDFGGGALKSYDNDDVFIAKLSP